MYFWCILGEKDDLHILLLHHLKSPPIAFEFAHSYLLRGLPWSLRQLKHACHYRRPGFDPWVRKIPWRREKQAIPGFLPGEFHGQRSLAGYSPWGCKELYTTEQLTLSPLKVSARPRHLKVQREVSIAQNYWLTFLSRGVPIFRGQAVLS